MLIARNEAGAPVRAARDNTRSTEWYDEFGDEQSSSYRPRTLRCPVKRPSMFALTCQAGRYREWAVVFAAQPAPA